MPSIRISRKHKKSIKEARTAVDRIAKAIAKKFDIEYVWDDNTLNFERAGVTALIVVLPTTLTLLAAVLPKLTLAPEAKPVPEIVTDVPPAVGPEDGESPATIGAVFGVPEKNSDILFAVAAAPG